MPLNNAGKTLCIYRGMKKLNDQVYLFDNQQLTGVIYPTFAQTGLVPNGTESGDYITIRRVRGDYTEKS